jgi:hypothetical protein
MDCRTALLTILDQVDYTAGNCRPNDMIGAVLTKEVIALCREAAQSAQGTESCLLCGGTGVYYLTDWAVKCRCQKAPAANTSR